MFFEDALRIIKQFLKLRDGREKGLRMLDGYSRMVMSA